jgi:hypothetical protein
MQVRYKAFKVKGYVIAEGPEAENDALLPKQNTKRYDPGDFEPFR